MADAQTYKGGNMRLVILRRSIFTSALLLQTLGLGSCTEATGPNETLPKVSRPVGVAPRLSSLFGDITITADNGVSYTLVEAQKEVHTSDGKILVLTDDQFLDAATAFETVVTMDASDSDLEAARGYYWYCVPNQAYCNPQWMRGSDDPQDRDPRHKTHGWLAPHRGHVGVSIRVGSQIPFDEGAPERPLGHGWSRTMPVLPTSPGIAWTYGGVCDDIANAALNQHENCRTKRTSFIDHFTDWAVAQVIDGVMKYFLDVGSQGATEFGTAVSGTVNSAIVTGYLAGLWASYDCANRSVYAGEVYRTMVGSGGPSSDAQYIGRGAGGSQCYLERAQISFNGGATWNWVTISKCYL